MPDDFFTLGATGRPTFVPSRLARRLRNQTPVATGGEALWTYEGGTYRPGGEARLRRRIGELLGEEWRRSHADETIAHLRDTARALDERPPTDVLNCTNGLLDLDTQRLEPHDPDLLTCVQLGAAYEPTDECPAIERFIDSVLAADARRLLIEIAAYCAVADNSLQRAFMFLGGGANGKSTALAALTSFLGPDNVSAVPLHKLDEDRFAVASLYGKLANVFPDLDQRALRSSSVFKSITGGDRLEAERKFRPAFTFTPWARLIFSANTAPPTTDSSEGFFRRWLILPFERSLEPGQRDPHLLRKLTTPEELSGLLNLALPALADLRTRGDFVTSETADRAAADFRTQVDSVAGFIEELCDVDPEARIAKPTLASTYRAWCTTNGRAPLSTMRFNERLQGLVAVEETTVQGVRMWRGLALREGIE